MSLVDTFNCDKNYTMFNYDMFGGYVLRRSNVHTPCFTHTGVHGSSSGGGHKLRPDDTLASAMGREDAGELILDGRRTEAAVGLTMQKSP